MENKKRSIFYTILILVIGIILGGGGLWLWNYFNPKTVPTVSQTDQTQIKELLSKVSKLTILPTGEDPAVATISDAPSLIKEQPFYKNTINGDIVLVYQKASKAIVYSPSRNLIVNIGPVFLQDNTPVATTTATSTGKK